jgi:hypothetical protein
VSKSYKIKEGGLHEKFQASHAKVQLFAGGYANGKTTAAVVKALKLARDYPGSNGLIARSTYPKLNDTTRKEFLAWCPPNWIERKPTKDDNTAILKNGTHVNFRYVAQTGKSNESSTSNLLSATYDWIIVDQIEDPEITEKDFLDLLGRLRGQTTYQGEDETMPSTGPRWFIVLSNPTRNWVYRKLVKPVQDAKNGIKNPDLLIDEETGVVQIELFEGSTYENKENLAPDYIKGLEMSYRGQMRQRFLLGEWGAYEGLVYSEYDPKHHVIDHELMLQYFDELQSSGAIRNTLEAYDHGLAAPACYGFGFVDRVGNVFLLDGFYEKEKTIGELGASIRRIRSNYGITAATIGDLYDPVILADPQIFKRGSGNTKSVGVTVSGLFKEEKIKMIRANNDITSGIAKVQSYLYIDPYHRHPIFEDVIGAPRLFVSNKLTWFDQEISDYYWKKNPSGEYEDAPKDSNDHAMDMTKYLFTNRPRVATFRLTRPPIQRKYTQWRETDTAGGSPLRNHRYGNARA